MSRADIAGQVPGLPVHGLFCGIGRARLACYGSRVNWFDDGGARAGGSSETRRIHDFADASHIRCARHVGWSGAICLAACPQLAAVALNFLMLEFMTYPKLPRDPLTVEPVVAHGPPAAGGEAPMPQRSGLGIAIDWATVERYRTR
ncbi:MAG: enolase C-terminal domain-like protein [Hyphomicrobiales bacterium]